VADVSENAPVEQLKMCQLKAKGMMAEIDRRSTAPTVVCSKCGAKANRAADLHNPLPLKKARLDNFWG